MTEEVKAMEPHRINAAALLLARGLPGRTALAHGTHTLSYAQLRLAVAQAAGAWLDCGVHRGEVVMLRGTHGIERTVAFLGAIWAGAVPVPLARTRTGTVGHAWDTQAPSRFILDDSRAGYANAWRDSVVTIAEWRWYLQDAEAAEPVALRETSPACWTEPRTSAGGGARLLPHGFALLHAGETALDGPARGTRVSTVSGVLRVLRRGGSCVLSPPGMVTRLEAPAVELAFS
ncbi:AMP-binding protein [Ramlibacter albus]|uniref:AMP-binding protein n=1 Tax=Ramlibacter albus TaxID=2079448 RepID=A0A923S530_9BURK|nr:AMP-binding protein [Ramlibacter albus]MBC5768140.1 AMP-binding protein [Ramlibacter albus]